MANVWIVSLEWNHPSSELVGDTGLVAVFDNQEAANVCAGLQRQAYDADGKQVYQFTIGDLVFCGTCGERNPCACKGPEGDAEDGFCEECGAELKDTGSCDNDHCEWDIDVHVTRMQVLSAFAPAPTLAEEI